MTRYGCPFVKFGFHRHSGNWIHFSQKLLILDDTVSITLAIWQIFEILRQNALKTYVLIRILDSRAKD